MDREKEIDSLIWLLYYMVLKLQIAFNLGLNPAKNTNYFKNVSNESCSKLNFVQKILERICLSHHGAELRASKDWYGCYIIWYWNCKFHSIYNLGELAQKIWFDGKNYNKAETWHDRSLRNLSWWIPLFPPLPCEHHFHSSKSALQNSFWLVSP